jgi:Zn-dependent protease
MAQGSFSLGKLFGIPVLMHWSVVLVVVMFGDSLAQQYGWLPASVALVAFLASILAHEFAHALVARRKAVNTISIQLWALGGIARLDREAPSARAEGWIASAGPLTSLVLGAVGLGGFFGVAALGGHGAWLGVLGWVGLINTALAAFNMLPGSPLDGGRVFKAWRWGRNGDRFRAAREAANAGKAIGFSMAGIGGVVVLNGHSGLILVLTGLFIAVSAKSEYIATDIAERLQGVRIRDLTWFGVAHATIDTDADTMLWQRSRLGGAGIVAVDRADGQLAGIVSEEQLLAVPEWRRATVSLASLMVPMNQIAQAQLDEELTDVLPRLSGKSPFVTVWREGKLLGVVPRRRLLGRLKAAQS